MFRAERGRVNPTDEGFTLIEVMVSVALITMMMAALVTFFVNTGRVANQQTGKQAAILLADDATERVRAIKGSAITTGRDKSSSDTQWANPVTGVAPYLTDMQEAWDATAAYPAGASAALPTTPLSVTINGLPYQQNFYIGQCWQPAVGGDCNGTQVAGYAQFFRVVIAITWTERNCTNATCAYLTATLVSSALSEPIFNPGATAVAPAINNPGTQVAEIGQPVGFQMDLTGGAPPITWSATGLPPGLTMSPSGLVSGIPTAPGTYTVNVSVTDGFALTGSSSYTWTIAGPPTLANPGAQTSQGGAPDSLTLSVTGGVAPFTFSVTAPGPWGATGLPPGLALNAATGVISGSPTATSGTAKNVTVKVTDALGGTSTVTFSWSVPPLSLVDPANLTDETSASISYAMTASGGIAPYTWSVITLPTGLAIDSTGTITGRPTVTGTFTPNATVTDAAGTSQQVNFVWKITQGPQITAPTATSRTDAAGAAVTITPSVTQGSGGNTWTATGLPRGLSINSSTGVISGTISTGTRYFTTIAVVDSAGGVDSFTFTWNVTASGTTLRVTNPTADRSNGVGSAILLTATAAGGSGGYTWTASGLPAGLSMSGGGTISGVLLGQGTYTVTLTVTDSGGKKAGFMFTWTVT